MGFTRSTWILIIAVAVAVSVIILYGIYSFRETGRVGGTSTTSPNKTLSTTPTSRDEEINSVEGLVINRLIKSYSHGVFKYTYHNISSGETQFVILEFRVSDDTVDGELVHKLFINYTTSKSNSTVTIWLSKNYDRIIQVMFTDRVLKDAYSIQLASEYLYSINRFLYSATRSNLVFNITDGEVVLLSEGWVLESYAPQMIDLGGVVVQAIYFRAVNTGDASTTYSVVEGKMAKLLDDKYALIEYRVIHKNGDKSFFETVELRK